jgi:hypothetical protein
MVKEEQRSVLKQLSRKAWGVKLIHQELTRTLGNDGYGPSQIKIWLQRFQSGDLSCDDSPGAQRPPLTLAPQLHAFLQKYLVASARAIAQHFLTIDPAVKGILQRELGMKQFSWGAELHFLSGQVAASKNSYNCHSKSGVREGSGLVDMKLETADQITKLHPYVTQKFATLNDEATKNPFADQKGLLMLQAARNFETEHFVEQCFGQAVLVSPR